MRKKILYAIMALIFALAPVAMVAAPVCHAAVGVQVGGTDNGQAAVINFTGPTALTNDGNNWTVPVVDKDLIAAGAGNSGATSMESTDETVPVAYSYIKKHIHTSATYDDGTLADGEVGQLLTVTISAVDGSGTFNIVPDTAYGWSNVNFDAVGETVTFLFVDSTTGWVIYNWVGATITWAD